MRRLFCKAEKRIYCERLNLRGLSKREAERETNVMVLSVSLPQSKMAGIERVMRGKDYKTMESLFTVCMY